MAAYRVIKCLAELCARLGLGAVVLGIAPWSYGCAAGDQQQRLTGSFTGGFADPGTGGATGGFGGGAGSIGGGGIAGTGGVIGAGGSGSLPSSPNDVDAGSDSCAVDRVEADLVREPVDIIMVLDNSGSMDDEVRSVEENINANFASILQEAGVDYRVILISEHRENNNDTSVCIESPLSGLDPCPGDEPVFTDRFFHYSTEIGSEDSLEIILDTYAPPFDDNDLEDEYGNAPDGWSAWLRPEAKKVFLEITDDNSDLGVQDFLAGMTALSPDDFGADPADPSFVWHSITGIVEKAVVTDAYGPDEDVVSGECEGNDGDVENAGEVYQELSRLTGGLRFPICQFDAYDVVFRTIAEDVTVTGEVACDFAVPAAPEGQAVELNKVAVSYTPGDGGDPQTFLQAADAGACQDQAFYVGDDRIVLCPEACDGIRTDPAAAIEVVFTCEETVVLF